MHLMIFDAHEQGHYLTYVRYMLQSAACADRLTLVLRDGVMQSAPYREQLQSRVEKGQVDPAIRSDSFHNGRHVLEDFQAALRRHRPDHVWIPSADLLVRHCNLAYALRRWRFPPNLEGECGLIELRFHHPPRRWRGHLRHLFDRTLLSVGPWARMHTIDPTVFTWARARGGRLGSLLHLLPDPVDDFTPVSKQVARRSLGIPEDGRYVGSVGAHAIPRKGSDLLVEAFSAASLASNDRLLLVGPLGDKLRQRLQTEFSHLYRSERIVVVERYLSDQELMTALAAMDVVCTPYINHFGSSGIVLRAAQAGRPVLAPNQNWFAQMVPRFGLGHTADILEVPALAREIRNALERSGDFRVSPACRRLIEYSDAGNFARLWAARVRERMGLPVDPAVRTWDWVLEATANRE